MRNLVREVMEAESGLLTLVAVEHDYYARGNM
jgi:hypothetical protein